MTSGRVDGVLGELSLLPDAGKDRGERPALLSGGPFVRRLLVGRVHRNIIRGFVARALVELENRTSRSQLKGTISIRKTGTLRLAATQSIGRSVLDGDNLG